METVRLMTQITTRVEIKNSQDVLTDPDSLEFKIRKPDGTVLPVSYPNDSINKVAVGIYEISVVLDAPGIWAVNAQSANPTVSVTDMIYCADRF